MPNREERRQQIREARKDKNAEVCPECGKKSLFVSMPTKEWLCDVKCIICHETVLEGCKGLIPMTYVSLESARNLSDHFNVKENNNE